MKILCLSDEESPALWDYYTPGKLDDYDLIISCGDLKASYLSFLVTMAKCPVLYVHGNHDTGYKDRPPEGCDCIDGHVVEYNGYRFVGLGGCPWYHPGAHQYTEQDMRRRIEPLWFPLWKSRGVDVLVTHAPPRGVGDLEDPAHMGFKALRTFLHLRKPSYMLHGHVHMRYTTDSARERVYEDTKVINVCERYVLELPEREVPDKKKNKLIYHTRRRDEYV